MKNVSKANKHGRKTRTITKNEKVFDSGKVESTDQIKMSLKELENFIPSYE